MDSPSSSSVSSQGGYESKEQTEEETQHDDNIDAQQTHTSMEITIRNHHRNGKNANVHRRSIKVASPPPPIIMHRKRPLPTGMTPTTTTSVATHPSSKRRRLHHRQGGTDADVDDDADAINMNMNEDRYHSDTSNATMHVYMNNQEFSASSNRSNRSSSSLSNNDVVTPSELQQPLPIIVSSSSHSSQDFRQRPPLLAQQTLYENQNQNEHGNENAGHSNRYDTSMSGSMSASHSPLHGDNGGGSDKHGLRIRSQHRGNHHSHRDTGHYRNRNRNRNRNHSHSQSDSTDSFRLDARRSHSYSIVRKENKNKNANTNENRSHRDGREPSQDLRRRRTPPSQPPQPRQPRHVQQPRVNDARRHSPPNHNRSSSHGSHGSHYDGNRNRNPIPSLSRSHSRHSHSSSRSSVDLNEVPAPPQRLSRGSSSASLESLPRQFNNLSIAAEQQQQQQQQQQPPQQQSNNSKEAILREWQELLRKKATIDGLRALPALPKPTPMMKKVVRGIVDRMNIMGVVVPFRKRVITLSAAILEVITLRAKCDVHGNGNDNSNVNLDSSQQRPRSPPRVQALIISPTRIQADQCKRIFDKVGQFWELSSQLMIGGIREHQICAQMGAGLDVISGTPGKLMSLVKHGHITAETMSNLVIVALDNADLLVRSRSFRHQLSFVLDQIPRMDTQIIQISSVFTARDRQCGRQYVREQLGIGGAEEDEKEDNNNRGVVDLVSDGDDDIDVLSPMLVNMHHLIVNARDDMTKMEQTIAIFKRHPHSRILIYFGKRSKCRNIHKFFFEKSRRRRYPMHGDRVCADLCMIDGGLKQERQMEILMLFEKSERCVLFTTDLLSRGLSFSSKSKLSVIINFDLPNVHQPQKETYITRCMKLNAYDNDGENSGANAGIGTVYSFVTFVVNTKHNNDHLSTDQQLMTDITNTYGTRINFQCSSDKLV